MKVTLCGLIDEDFVNYKKPSMYIGMPKCDFKCDKECGEQVCQNSALATSKRFEIDVEDLFERYINNPITEAIVIAGLEPFDSFDDLYAILSCFRINKKCQDDIVIYTGYNLREITHYLGWLMIKQFNDIHIKYGRFIPNRQPVYNEQLGVTLASDNQGVILWGESLWGENQLMTKNE